MKSSVSKLLASSALALSLMVPTVGGAQAFNKDFVITVVGITDITVTSVTSNGTPGSKVADISVPMSPSSFQFTGKLAINECTTAVPAVCSVSTNFTLSSQTLPSSIMVNPALATALAAGKQFNIRLVATP